MTDEEISEFAEYLGQCCDRFREQLRCGVRCPLGCLPGVRQCLPSEHSIGIGAYLTACQASAFMFGYDGLRSCSPALTSFFALGRTFREEYRP